MKLLFKAHGSPSFGLFLIRLIIGGTFLIAGAHKIINIEAFINYVKGLGSIPPNLAFILAFILPVIEIVFGALYLIGFFTPITSFILSAMLLSIILVSPQMPYQAYTIPASTMLYLMLACTIGTIFSGAGHISFDAFIDKPKKKIEKVTVTEHQSNTYPETVTKETTFEEIKNGDTDTSIRSEDIK